MTMLVIGVGNPLRGDDAAGLEVARRLTSVPALAAAHASYDLVEMWEGVDDVIIVDAARSGSPAGTIHRYDAVSGPLPAAFTGTSTHSAGIADAVEMARSIERLPQRLTVYGIEVEDVTLGNGLSPVVEAAVAALVEEIERA